MAFTKITHAGIGSTGTVLLENLEVTGVGTFGGSVSVGGTLTYEDVTNIDSVGLITARNGIVVGSGITLSKDGDVFFTGIATGNGSGLTNLPAANLTGTLPAISGANLTNLDASDLASGTVPTARLGSGTASSSTFLRGDSTFQTVNTDLVSDTSPQLGGNLDAGGNSIIMDDNSKLRLGNNNDLEIHHNGSINIIDGAQSHAISFRYGGNEQFFIGNAELKGADNKKIKLGTGDDLQIYHDGSNTYLANTTGTLLLQNTGTTTVKGSTVQFENAAGTEVLLKAIQDGAVELYHNNAKKLNTLTNGVQINGQEFISEGTIYFEKSGAHHHRILANDTGNDLGFQQSSDTGANTNFTTYLRIKDGGNIALPVDAQKLIFGAGSDLEIYHDGGSGSYIDNTTGTADLYIRNVNGNSIYLNPRGTEVGVKVIPDGAVELYHNNTKMFETMSTGFKLVGDKAISLDAWQGRLDRAWGDYPSISISGSGTYGYQSEFRLHGIEGTVVGYGNAGDYSIDFRVDGTFITGSDQRRKTNIEEITGALDTVKQLTGKKFNVINRSGELDPNKGTQKQFGLIAQECKDIIPEAVKFYPDEDTPNENGWASAYSIDYPNLSALLINAVKELSAKNDALETRIAALEG